MPIIPNNYRDEQPSPRDLLIIDIMVALDHAIEGDESLSTYDVAAQIVDLVEERESASSA